MFVNWALQPGQAPDGAERRPFVGLDARDDGLCGLGHDLVDGGLLGGDLDAAAVSDADDGSTTAASAPALRW